MRVLSIDWEYDGVIQIRFPTREYSSDWGCGNCTSQSHGTLANSSTDELTPRISKMPLIKAACKHIYVIELHWMWIIISQLLDPAKWRRSLSLIEGAWSEKAANRVKRLNRKKDFRVSWMAMSGYHLSCACTSRNLREPVESWLLTTSCWIRAKRYEMSRGRRQKEGLRGCTMLQCSRH